LYPIDFHVGTVSIRVEAVPEHGMATIWDADVLIWAASQIVEARDSGLKTSRLRPPQGRARPVAVDHRHDVDPPTDGAPAASLLLDQ
jgi:hypothetical protein